MEFKEGLSEASGESGGRLGYAALCTCKFGSEAGEEVVLGLFGSEDADGRQYAESVGREEDDVLGSRTGRNGAHNLLYMVDRIGNAGVLGNGLVCEINLAVLVHGNVLEECITADSVVDVGFGLFVKVNDFGVASAFEVEYTFIVPAVFVIADEQTFGVGREGGLTRTAQSEEDGGVLAVHIGVGGAVHRSDAFEGEVVVLHREHTFLHLAAVPRIDDDLFAGSGVESNAGSRVKSKFLVVIDFGFGGVVDNEIGFE